MFPTQNRAKLIARMGKIGLVLACAGLCAFIVIGNVWTHTPPLETAASLAGPLLLGFLAYIWLIRSERQLAVLRYTESLAGIVNEMGRAVDQDWDERLVNRAAPLFNGSDTDLGHIDRMIRDQTGVAWGAASKKRNEWLADLGHAEKLRLLREMLQSNAVGV